MSNRKRKHLLADLRSSSQAIRWEARAPAVERWSAQSFAAANGPATVSIFEPIGFDMWTGEGWTAKRMAGVLRSVGDRPLTVDINSPGGDVFEGLAIYNLLAMHSQPINVRVLGVAASAASVIAMAGDEITMGGGAFIMIHNAWGVAVGDRNDMRSMADLAEQFDGAMADIYAARAGYDRKKIVDMMDAETYMNASTAIELGFADAEMDVSSRLTKKEDEVASARARLDVLLAKAGVTRSERRDLFRQALSTPRAAETDTPRAVDPEVMAALARLEATFKL